MTQNVSASSCHEVFVTQTNPYLIEGRKNFIRLRLEKDPKWRDFVEQRMQHLEVMNSSAARSDAFFFDDEIGIKLLLEEKIKEYVSRRETMDRDREGRIRMLFSRQIEFFSFFKWRSELDPWVLMFYIQNLSFFPTVTDPKWYPQLIFAIEQLILKASVAKTDDLNKFFAEAENIKPYADLIARLNAEDNYILNHWLLVPGIY